MGRKASVCLDGTGPSFYQSLEAKATIDKDRTEILARDPVGNKKTRIRNIAKGARAIYCGKSIRKVIERGTCSVDRAR